MIKMSKTDNSAIELKLLLSGWKLEKLYDTFKDEDIFIEELEMMTMEHLELILRDYKMGVRIRFEYHFKKWRSAIGAPLEQCESGCHKNNAVDKKPIRSIALPEQHTQTDNVSKSTHAASTQISPESTTVKIRHDAEKLREVLNSSNYQHLTTTKAKAKAENLAPQPSNIVAPTNDLIAEQPSTTTFHDATSPPPAAAPPPPPTAAYPNYINSSQFGLVQPNVSFVPVQVNTNLLQLPENNPLATTSAAAAKLNHPIMPPIIKSLVSPKISTTPPDTTVKKVIIPKASLKRRFIDERSSATAKDFLNANINIVRKYGSKGLLTNKSSKKMNENSVLNILLTEGNQGLQLLQQYEQNEVFTTKERELLVQVICEYYHRQNSVFTVDISDKVVGDILELFPSEELKNYQKGKHGKIFKRYFEMTRPFEHTSDAITLSDSSDAENAIDLLDRSLYVKVNRKVKQSPNVETSD